MIPPYDYRKRPYRNLDEERLLAHWHIFGESDGVVDVADIDGDIVQHIPREAAQRLVDARHVFLMEVDEVLQQAEER